MLFRLCWLVAHCCMLNVSGFALATVVTSATASDDEEGDWGDGWPYEYEVPDHSNTDLWDETNPFDKYPSASESTGEPLEPSFPSPGVVNPQSPPTLDDENALAANAGPGLKNTQQDRVETERDTKHTEPKDIGLSKKKQRIQKKQQKRDARLVQRILSAAERNDHYAVLGIQRRSRMMIPSRTIRVFRNKWSISTPVIFDIKPEHIQRVKGQLDDILQTSTDERSKEALQAVQHATDSLLNERKEQELQLKPHGGKRSALRKPLMNLARFAGNLGRWLGPFLVPIALIFLLVI